MSKFTDKINEAKKIAVMAHVNPDADALCSCLAIRRIIENNFDYKAVDVFLDGEIGPLYEPVLRTEGINPTPYKQYDLAIVLDCPNIARTGKYAEIVNGATSIINVDHHETNDKFGELAFVVPTASSTCEVVYLIAKSSELGINNIIARQLYQGIITDTNCFTSFSINKTTHRVISELMQYKFDHDAIKMHYFKNNSVAKTELVKEALLSMSFYCDEKFTTMKLRNNIFEKVGATFEDTLGIIDNGINISGIEVSAIIIEKEPGKMYVSLRSKGKVNVGEVAAKFNGGGSEKLAAFQVQGDMKDVEEELLKVIGPELGGLESDETIIC